MCGIYGYFSFGRRVDGDLLLKEMAGAIRHRGPDGEGDEHVGRVGIGNVRLAIIDPDGGDQPVVSDDGDVAVVQNGEIFNFRELRKKLEEDGIRFKSNCDTEVLLYLYKKVGISFLEMLNGMFAIAIHDRRTGDLYLARDRIGEKPLYYYRHDDVLYFASEIKAFLPYVDVQPDLSSLNAFLRLNYIPPPYTAYQGVFHVLPGEYLVVNESGVNRCSWWSLSCQSPENISREEWKEEFLDLLEDAVKIRLVSDVPFGAFLSGGIDSSSVVALMSRNMDSPVNTYAIGFKDEEFDESRYAASAARKFNTNHVCEFVDKDIVSEWQDFIYYCDQPHGDVSFMPMRKVAELASSSVKMVLTGDGADELFAGYEKYVPYFSRDWCGGPVGGKDKDFLSGYMPYISMFGRDDCREIWNRSCVSMVDMDLVDRMLLEALDEVPHFDYVNKVLYLDMKFLLPGNNLVKPDRMAMSVSLETRAPFLDYRMMEFAFRTPGEFKLFNGIKKYLYKEAVEPILGRELVHRKKQMFTMPIGKWLRGELLGFCKETLLSEDSRLLEFYKKSRIEEMVSHHESGVKNYTREIRALISIELWMRQVF